MNKNQTDSFITITHICKECNQEYEIMCIPELEEYEGTVIHSVCPLCRTQESLWISIKINTHRIISHI